MALDPVSALGVAAAVVQFVEFGGKMLSGVYEIYKSENETLEEHSELQKTAGKLQNTTDSLDKSLHLNSLGRPLTDNERELQTLGKTCQKVASELFVAIEELRVQSSSKKWRSFRQALNTIWSQEKIDRLARRLDEVREQLVICIVVSLREKADIANKQQETAISRIDQVNADIKSVGQEFLSYVNDTQRWRSELVEAIHEQRWQPGASLPYGYASQCSTSKRLQLLGEKFLMRLRFSNIDDRKERIALAHEKTFQWIYNISETEMSSWVDFPSWLSTGTQLYWITGKPGCGKSTLMKFIYKDARTYEFLRVWAAGSKLLKAPFFFWNSGTRLQMSREGMLRSLLYTILDQCRPLISHVFPERWQVFDIFGDDYGPWSWVELHRAFKLLLSTSSAFGKVFFLIDGLDEFDGDHTELVELIKIGTTYEHIKFCVSSRPWIVFQEAFNDRPSLLVQQLTYPDIKLYITTHFLANSGFALLQRQNHKFANDLLDNIATKAEGVFLWVVLVVKSLLEGIRNGDRISDLDRRLQALPPELEDLFEKMLGSLDSFYFEHAAELFQLVRAAQAPPSLLCLSFADQDDSNFCLKQPIEPLNEMDCVYRAEVTFRRVNSRCKGLLEVTQLSSPTHPAYQASNSSSNFSSVSPATLKSSPHFEKRGLRPDQPVQYLHRTVRDFLEEPRIWSRITSATKKSFNPDISLCRSFVCQLKIIEPKNMDIDLLWDTVLWCIEYAARSQKSQANTCVDLLSEVDRVADYLSNVKGVGGISLLESKGVIEEFSATHWTSTRLNWVYGCTFMHLMAICDLYEYLGSKFDFGEPALLSPKSTPLLISAICDYDVFANVENRTIGKKAAPSVRTVKLLLEHGADPNQVFEGLSVFQKASSQYILERKRSQGPDMAPSELEWLEVLALMKEHGAEEFDPTFWRVLRTSEKNRADRRQNLNSKAALAAQSSRTQSGNRVDGSKKGLFRTLFGQSRKNKQFTSLLTQDQTPVWRRRTELFPGGSIYEGHIGFELVDDEP